MNELVAPESMRAVIGSALDFRMVVSVWSSEDIFSNPIQILYVLY